MKTRNWYYVEIEKRSGREFHEVHKEDCRYMPRRENRIYLGNFYDCGVAKIKAEKNFPNEVALCSNCCSIPEADTEITKSSEQILAK